MMMMGMQSVSTDEKQPQNKSQNAQKWWEVIWTTVEALTPLNKMSTIEMQI